MSKGIRRPVVKAPFETKRVIVAACAAVAMVMGAMSVTSSISSSSDPDKTHISSLMSSTVQATSSQPVASSELTSKHTIEVRGLIQQQSTPLYNSPPKVKASKPIRDTVTQVMATVNPTLFLTEIVQLQQPAQSSTDTTTTGNTSTSSTSSTDPAKSGADTSTTTSSDTTNTTTTNPSKDTSTTPADPSQQPQGQSMTAPSSTTNTPAPTNP